MGEKVGFQDCEGPTILCKSHLTHGRFPHVENLVIELLGSNLGDIVEDMGKLTAEYVLKLHIKWVVGEGSGAIL